MEYYKVIKSENIEEFAAMVNEAIKKGFKPIGGISTVVDNYGVIVYVQALSFI